MTLSRAQAAALDVSARQELLRRSYGGSDRTDASFTRPQFNRYNSVSKSRDLGPVDNLAAELSGVIGGTTGSQTLYFSVTLNGPADLRISKIPGNPREDQYISVGICGADHKPLQMDSDGFAVLNDVVGTTLDESTEPLPAGRYLFSVSSSQWQALPFAVRLLVLRYRELAGSCGGAAPLVARIALVKLAGSAGGRLSPTATIPSNSRIKRLSGSGGGSATGAMALVIPSGVATGTMVPSGRIKATWRISGSAGGTGGGRGELTVIAGGGGYGY